MHHIHPHGWRNKAHPQTKQSRKTIRRRQRQARAYALFERDRFKRLAGLPQTLPLLGLVPMTLKQKIVEKYG